MTESGAAGLSSGPSRTAMAVASARAYHFAADQPVILRDHLAAQLLGVDVHELIERYTATLGSDPANAGWRRLRRYFLVGRARFAEDVVASAFRGGDGQVVILGAGLDTFAYRNPGPTIQVFEVDHPSTQDWKRARLARAGISVPDSVTFVPVDFETDRLGTRLADAGFDRSRPTVYIWLGVVMYLTSAAIRQTLADIAPRDGRAWLVVDYLPHPADATDRAKQAMDNRAKRVAAIGEPWQSFFRPPEIAALLAEYGFGDVEDKDAYQLLREFGVQDFGAAPGGQSLAPHVLRARG